MAFNLFGKRKEPTPPPEVPDESTAVEDEGELDDVVPEDDGGAEALDAGWRDRAAAVIPGGSSTGSKQPHALYGPDGVGPAHYVRASGCHLVTAGDQTLIDCTMALGSVALGYGDDGVTRAVVSAVASGHVAGLAHVTEVEVAERLCEVIPCAERVRFLKSGGEAMSAAVRIARVSTGRERIVACGYFGWQDWSSTGPGVPEAVSRLVTRVPFNDLAALETAVKAAGRELAAVVIEPVIEAFPDGAWLERARALCDEVGAVLIFDEMKTGFRVALGGYQQVAGVTPDLAVFGKAMANGFPVAAVVGRAPVMEAAGRTWITSTSAGETVALAAVHAVLDRYLAEEGDPCAVLARVGGRMRAAVAAAIEASGVDGVEVVGPDPMWFLRFADPGRERHFLERAAWHGVLFKRGAYNYASLAHDDEDVLLEVERVASTAFVEVVEGVA
ncbi:MAG: aminotransferase class III-fold pyridoxal phosphate-dependent enzyme [Gemmatimonadetes bacterium]|nr:aminotransferase class III-fold pyridoxal phosphate-dependent enzyme [Gemmatimonadota bacterium]